MCIILSALARNSGDLTATKLLLASGANPIVLNSRKESAFSIAKKHDHTAFMEELNPHKVVEGVVDNSRVVTNISYF